MSDAPAAGASALTSADLLQVLMEQLPDAFYFKDAQCRYVRINRTLATWYGLKDPQDAVGKTDADFFTEAFARTSDETEQEILKSGLPRVDVEEKLVRTDGRVIYASSTRLPLRNVSGEIIGTFGFFTDIGPHLQARKEVRRVEGLYRSLVDNLPQNFFRKDLDGRIVFANREYCRTLGRPLKELLGKTDLDLFPEKMANKYREDDARVLRTGHALDVVEAHKPPGKGVLFVRVVKTPVYDSEQRPVGVQGIFWEVPSEKSEAPAKPKAPAASKKKKAAPRPAKRARKK